MNQENTVSVEKMLETVYKTLDDRKGIDVKVYDLRGISAIADYFVIASGTSDRHIDSLADYTQEELIKLGVRPLHKEGKKSGTWVLLDYGDIVIHVFHHESRDHYGIEKLWSDAPEVIF